MLVSEKSHFTNVFMNGNRSAYEYRLYLSFLLVNIWVSCTDINRMTIGLIALNTVWLGESKSFEKHLWTDNILCWQHMGLLKSHDSIVITKLNFVDLKIPKKKESNKLRHTLLLIWNFRFIPVYIAHTVFRNIVNINHLR